MEEDRGGGFGNHPWVVWVGLIASLIGILSFVTGKQRLSDFFEEIHSATNRPERQLPTVQIPQASEVQVKQATLDNAESESGLDSTPITNMKAQGAPSEPAPNEEWSTITIQGEENGALAAQPENDKIDQKIQNPESEDAGLGLASANVYIIYSGAREEDASEVKKRLSSAGANVSMDEEVPGDSGSYSWNRLVYSECHQGAARAIKESVRDVVRITLMRSAEPCGPNMVLYLVS